MSIANQFMFVVTITYAFTEKQSTRVGEMQEAGAPGYQEFDFKHTRTPP